MGPFKQGSKITRFIAVIALCYPLLVMAFQADFTISGVSDEIKINLLSRLNTATRHLGNHPTPDRLQQFTAELPDNIKQALAPYGYFHPSITITHPSESKFILKIVPGKLMRMKTVTIRVEGAGSTDLAFVKLLAKFPLKQGDPLSIKQYNASKQLLYQTAEKQGYLHAKMITSQIKIDTLNEEAHVVLIFDTKTRYYFGPVHYSEFPLSPRLLDKYSAFLQGKAFSTSALLAFQDNLNNSDYFASVEVKPTLDKPQGTQIPIEVLLTPNQTRQYTYGIGYGTDTKVRGTLGLQIKRLNQWGHHFQGYVQGSPVQSNIRTIYIIPGKNPVTDEYHLSASVFRQNLDDVDSNAMQYGLAYLSTYHEWQRTIGVSTLFEREFNGRNTPNKTTSWLYPNLNLKRIQSDDNLNTTEGWSFNANLLGGNKAVLSDASFIQGKMDLKWIHQLQYRTRVLLRTSVGYTGIHDITALAPSLRFYTGGTQSIRGYHYQSIGPGKYLLANGCELQFLIKDKWSIAAFFDSGNVSDNLIGHLRRGVGIGLVRSSPIGSINIGVAKPLDAHNKTPQFVFSMGPDLL